MEFLAGSGGRRNMSTAERADGRCVGHGLFQQKPGFAGGAGYGDFVFANRFSGFQQPLPFLQFQ